VESGGSIDVAGHIDFESGGYVTVESGGYIDVSDGGYIKMPVVADTSSASLANFGVSTLNVDSSAPTTFTLATPAAGVVKHIFIDDGASASGLGYIYVGAGVTIASSASSTEAYLKVDTVDSRLSLVGLSTTRWALIYKSTGVTASTGPA
jgi:hypothetical protein